MKTWGWEAPEGGLLCEIGYYGYSPVKFYHFESYLFFQDQRIFRNWKLEKRWYRRVWGTCCRLHRRLRWIWWGRPYRHLYFEGSLAMPALPVPRKSIEATEIITIILRLTIKCHRLIHIKLFTWHTNNGNFMKVFFIRRYIYCLRKSCFHGYQITREKTKQESCHFGQV